MSDDVPHWCKGCAPFFEKEAGAPEPERYYWHAHGMSKDPNGAWVPYHSRPPQEDGAPALTDALAALLGCQELFDKALPKFNWGASALDADSIRLLNEVPIKVRAILAASLQESTK